MTKTGTERIGYFFHRFHGIRHLLGTFPARLGQAPKPRLDPQVVAVFDKMQVEDEGVRDWFRMVLASETRDAQAASRAQQAELQWRETLIVAGQDRLLNMRLGE